MAFSFYRLKVLVWADILALYTIWMTMPYLTDVWKLNLSEAAAIINIFWSLFYLTLFPFLYIVDTITGNFWMLLLSSLSSSCGLGLLALSTPPVLHRITDTCKEYQPECIGEEQKIMFYVALALIAVGFSGILVSFLPFVTEQSDQIVESQAEIPTTYSLVFLVAIVLLYINPWSIRFGVQAIVTVSATVVFFTAVCLYRRVKPQGSPLTAVFRVLVAAAGKMFHRLPEYESELFEAEGLYRVPHSRRLRCLDKAAIVEARPPLEEQMKKKWRICRITEIEETKSILQIIPICFFFIILGLISSLNSTFFVSQANHMNKKVGTLRVPVPILYWFYHTFKYQFMRNYLQFVKWIGTLRSNRYASDIGIAVSIVFAVLCCVVAADVETRRLRVVVRHGLVDKPDETVPMTMFWLLPQFILMGCMEGTFWSCVSFLFDRNNIPVVLNRYLVLFSSGVIGIGFLGSIVSIHVVDIVTGRKGKERWFKETLNESRLDKYYWTMAALSAGFLVVYISAAALCRCFGKPLNPAEEHGDEDEEVPVDIDIRCCCCYFTYFRN